jgi:hypothetical protein
MKKQHLSIGAFVNRLLVAEAMLARKGLLKHAFSVTSVFGTFPNVSWNGGRTLVQNWSNIAHDRDWYREISRQWYDPTGMEELVKSYNNRKIGIRYTYSNNLITKRHLSDNRANLTLEIAHNPLNAVITGNEVIERYVRTHYPKFKIISSATSAKNLSVPFLKKRMDQVDLLVLPPEYNGRYDLIEKLGPEKIEILINERCVPFCANRASHYKSISLAQLSWDNSFQSRNYFTRCPVFLARQKGCNVATMELPDSAITTLQGIGVRNFKLAGRHLSLDAFVMEVDRMLVKDRYRPFTL